MARDGSGTYNLIAAATVPANSLTSSTNFNATMADLAAALTQSLSKDGQTTATGNQPMGTFRHTNVGAAAALTDYARADQVQTGAMAWGGTAAGTADAQTIDLTPAISAYTTGMRVAYLSPATANTAAVTLAINSLATKSVKSHDGHDLAPLDIPASSLVHIIYDGTSFRLAGPLPPRNNLIINGGMTVDQRNSGGAVTPVASTVTLDRWSLNAGAASKITAQQIATGLTPGASRAHKLLVAAGYTAGAADQFSVQQNIEGIDVSHLGWGATGALALAVSFDFYSSATGTFAVSVTNSAGSRSYVKTLTYSSAATWQRVALVFPGDTTGTWLGTAGVTGISVRLDLGSGSNYETTVDTWAGGNFARTSGTIAWIATTSREIRFTRVKAEVASPTAFVAEDASVALNRCLRFYQPGICATFAGSIVSGVSERVIIHHPVEMCKTPTLTFSNESVTSFPAGNPTTTGSNKVFSIFDKTANATGGGIFSYDVVASAEL